MHGICSRLIVSLFLIGVLIVPLRALTAEREKMDNLIVFGDEFMFVVKEPPGWTGDTENAAKMGVNILFYRNGQTLRTAKEIIRKPRRR